MTDSQFTQYYNENYNALMNFAGRFVRNAVDAEDLVQETAMKAFKGKHTFKVGTSFKSWAFTILRNTFITKYNKKKRRNTVSQPVEDLIYAADKSILTTNQGESNMRMEALANSFDLLTYKCRLPFMLYVEGYQYAEIAKSLNIPIGTVKSRINFARTKLKDNSIIQELRRA